MLSGYNTASEKGVSTTNYDDIVTELILMAVDDNDKFGFMAQSDDMSFASDT